MGFRSTAYRASGMCPRHLNAPGWVFCYCPSSQMPMTEQDVNRNELNGDDM